MQAEKNKEKIKLFADFPPALPPARENTEAFQKKRIIKAGILLRAICLLTSVSFLTLSALRNLRPMLDMGVTKYIGNALLGIGTDVFGENVNSISFGEVTDEETVKKAAPLAMPDVYYIPFDEIRNEILENAKQHEKNLEKLYSFDSGAVPKGAYPIIPTDSSASDALKIKNDTAFRIDIESIASEAKELHAPSISEEPLVLIVHTHGTEAFAKEGVPYYNDDINYPRSEDASKNIVAVGKVLCDTLNESGIPTIHCETMHDKDSYIDAYERTAQSIKCYIEKYPSIEYVFDVHRDSLIHSDLTKLKPVTLYKDEPCAQVMMIIGSSEKSSVEYDWQSNLVLAQAIQQSLFKNASGIARQLYLRGATYNQQYTKHGLLVEIGSCGNTLSEAKVAAKAFGESVAEVILGE